MEILERVRDDLPKNGTSDVVFCECEQCFVVLLGLLSLLCSVFSGLCVPGV